MVQLVVMTCLLATPEQCGEHVVPGTEVDNIITCLKAAGDKADEWQKANSQYFVIGWRCEKKDKK